MWDYREALAWLYARQKHGIKLGLGPMEELLQRVGNPQDRLKIAHVAGTNGKGTVCTLLAASLHEAGHRTGLYTSPHLTRFTERIKVGGQEIGREDVARHLATLQPHVEAMGSPTFFEVTTALALLHFAETCDWVVLETGLGGRMDATNVVASAVTVITNIELDHTEYLGDTIPDIAFEKAGIMKPGVPLITSAVGDGLLALKATSQALHVPMSIVGDDYQVMPALNGFALIHPHGEAHYDLALAGDHQLTNAALVVATCDALRQHGLELPPRAVHLALANTQMPGRLERFTTPASTVLLDGAHNEAGAHALRRALGRTDQAGFTLVFSAMQDKNWQAVLDAVMPLAKRVLAVPLQTPRGLDPAHIVAYASRAGWPADVSSLETALDTPGDVVVMGSLWLVGAARAYLTGEPLEDVGEQ